MKRLIALTATAGLLSACSAGNPNYNFEAGSQLDSGSFGNATMNNTLVQTGAIDYMIDLNNRFQSEVQTTITFAFNSAVLDDQARAVLRQQAVWISQFPEVRFKVYGHTDLVGSSDYNRRLGQRRAEAAVAYLVSQGISHQRLEAVVSFGETQPLVVTEGRERRNRRTVTEVSGFMEDDPLVLDGKYAEIVYRDYVGSAVPPSQLTGIQGADVATEQ